MKPSGLLAGQNVFVAYFTVDMVAFFVLSKKGIGVRVVWEERGIQYDVQYKIPSYPAK